MTVPRPSRLAAGAELEPGDEIVYRDGTLIVDEVRLTFDGAVVFGWPPERVKQGRRITFTPVGAFRLLASDAERRALVETVAQLVADGIHAAGPKTSAHLVSEQGRVWVEATASDVRWEFPLGSIGYEP